jgi:hypothetical protein
LEDVLKELRAADAGFLRHDGQGTVGLQVWMRVDYQYARVAASFL